MPIVSFKICSKKCTAYKEHIAYRKPCDAIDLLPTKTFYTNLDLDLLNTRKYNFGKKTLKWEYSTTNKYSGEIDERPTNGTSEQLNTLNNVYYYVKKNIYIYYFCLPYLTQSDTIFYMYALQQQIYNLK